MYLATEYKLSGNFSNITTNKQASNPIWIRGVNNLKIPDLIWLSILK